MPSYGTTPARAIGPGDQVTLVNNAAVDANVTRTQQLCLADSPGFDEICTLSNTTNQTATVQVATTDTVASYKAFTNADTNEAITVAAGSAITFTSTGPFLCCTFATAPTSGSLVLSR